mgnify:CR=1 FL=1
MDITDKLDKLIMEASENIQVGDKVKILNGKFKGKVGKVLDYSVEEDDIEVKVGGQSRFFRFEDVKEV